MYTLKQREQIAADLTAKVTAKFPDKNRYNVLFFGSFLTERYREDSDIDLGVFSLDRRLSFQIRAYLADLLDQLGLQYDIVDMDLDEGQYINVSIILYHGREMTDYCPPELIRYTRKMLDLYGPDPMETAHRRIVKEVGLHDSNW